MTPARPPQAISDSDDLFAFLRRRYCAKRSDKVGSVGLAREAAASSYPTTPKDGRIESDSARPKPVLSDPSDDCSKRSDKKKPNDINTYPTYPTENEGAGEKADNLIPAAVPSIPTDVAGLPILDTKGEQLPGNASVLQAVLNQRRVMFAQAEQTTTRAHAAVNPALAADPGEVWLRGEVDE
ncbi:MAG: hypothetical protein AAGA21_10685 [Pseudomonadota bacterium]